MDKNNFDKVTYIFVLLLSIILIFIGYNLAIRGTDYKLLENKDIDNTNVSAVVLSIRDEIYDELTGDSHIYFVAKINHNKKEVICSQIINQNDPTVAVKSVEAGDKILMDNSIDNQWQFTNYIRTDMIIYLALIFILLVLIFGRVKGFNTLVSLLFTCLAVFIVFVPAVIAGKNIYIWSILICIYSIFMTIFIVNGTSIKSFMAILGCIGGILVAGILTIIMNKLLNWNGILDSDSQRLIMELPDINLLGIIFASVTIGAMGAVMDVAMAMASSLYELKIKVINISPKELYKSGMEIGKDMMGTMANTLVLAYIGSSMSTTILQILYNASLFELLNKERIIMEFMQALVGSLGILLAIPLTAFVCSIWYQKIIISEENESK